MGVEAVSAVAVRQSRQTDFLTAQSSQQKQAEKTPPPPILQLDGKDKKEKVKGAVIAALRYLELAKAVEALKDVVKEVLLDLEEVQETGAGIPKGDVYYWRDKVSLALEAAEIQLDALRDGCIKVMEIANPNFREDLAKLLNVGSEDVSIDRKLRDITTNVLLGDPEFESLYLELAKADRYLEILEKTADEIEPVHFQSTPLLPPLPPTVESPRKNDGLQTVFVPPVIKTPKSPPGFSVQIPSLRDLQTRLPAAEPKKIIGIPPTTAADPGLASQPANAWAQFRINPHLNMTHRPQPPIPWEAIKHDAVKLGEVGAILAAGVGIVATAPVSVPVLIETAPEWAPAALTLFGAAAVASTANAGTFTNVPKFPDRIENATIDGKTIPLLTRSDLASTGTLHDDLEQNKDGPLPVYHDDDNNLYAVLTSNAPKGLWYSGFVTPDPADNPIYKPQLARKVNVVAFDREFKTGTTLPDKPPEQKSAN